MSENSVSVDFSVGCIEYVLKENQGKPEGGGFMTPQNKPLLV